MGRPTGSAIGGVTVRRWLATAAVAPSVLALGGCHAYVASSASGMSGGHQVAVVLNDRGRMQVENQLGESVLTIYGSIVESTDSLLSMKVARTVQVQGSSVIWAGELVRIPRAGISGVRGRTFSRERSAALVAGGLGVLVFVARRIDLNGGGTSRPDEPAGCQTSCSADR